MKANLALAALLVCAIIVLGLLLADRNLRRERERVRQQQELQQMKSDNAFLEEHGVEAWSQMLRERRERQSQEAIIRMEERSK